MTKRISAAVIFILVGLVLGFGILYVGVQSEVGTSEGDFHEHADFAVVVDGVKLDFSGAKYMHAEPCAVEGLKIFPEALAHGSSLELSDKVHMHNFNGNVVHVHEEGITWHDFFDSLGLDIADRITQEGKMLGSEGGQVTFVLNGEQKDSTVLDLEIRDGNALLVSYGKLDGVDTRLALESGQFLTHDACISSGTCPSRGAAPVESCGDAGNKKRGFFTKLLGLPE